MKERGKGMQSIGEIMRQGPPELCPPSPTMRRMVEASAAIHQGQDDGEIAFHHTYFCQTALPYRETKDRTWVRQNGHVFLRVDAGGTVHPETMQPFDFPLPFGPCARLILIHLDTEAIRRQSPQIELEHSMTAFVKGIQGRDPTGPELRKFKQQAAAISTATFRFGAVEANRISQGQGTIVEGLELWFPKDERQRVLWPSYVHLNPRYFETLKLHAVPLDHRAISALQHNGMALDIYKWLAQRLYRIKPKQPAFMPWTEVQMQFGQEYTRIRAFRAVFLKTLKMVLLQYPGAKVSPDERGLTLYQSRPPIAPKQIAGGL